LYFKIFAGIPPTMAFGGTSLITTEFAPIIELSEIEIPSLIKTLDPIQT
jgi:hypothetical protein